MNISRSSALFEETLLEQDSSTRSTSRQQGAIDGPGTSQVMIAKTNLKQCDVVQETVRFTRSMSRKKIGEAKPTRSLRPRKQ